MSTRRLRVLYSFSDRFGLTGIGNTAWQQVNGLAAHGNQVTVMTPSCERECDPRVTMIETLRPAGWRLPLRRVASLDLRHLHDYFVAHHIQRFNARYDVVHVWPSGALRTLRMARQYGLATCLERPNAHTRFAFEVVAREYARLGLVQPIGHSHTWDRRRLLREEQEFALADRLLCPSEFVTQTFVRAGFPQHQLAQHQYGFDPRQFNLHTEAISQEDRFEIAFVGRCEPRKGLHFALEAWLASKASDRGRFHIAGQFVPGYRDCLAHQLEHPSIIQHGFVPDVQRLLRQCDALVLPSLEEGSALVTYEAMACGCLLLVSRATGARCTPSFDGLVHEPGDVDMLRDQLSLLAADSKARQILRTGAITSAQGLTWHDAAKRLAQVYAELLEAKTTGVTS